MTLCDTGNMNFQSLIYIPGNSLVHRCDARAKILLLFAFTIAIFFVRTWWGMAVFASVVVAAAAVARIPLRALLIPLVPVMVLGAFSALFAISSSPGIDGFLGGGFVAVRMVVMVAGSLVVCLTSSSTELLKGFSRLIRPLRVARVPVEDVAFTLALALRFIPVIAAEFRQVRMAQLSRGGDVANMPFTRKLHVWGVAFSAVFIGLFRHADALADAMDARCYGATSRQMGKPEIQ